MKKIQEIREIPHCESYLRVQRREAYATFFDNEKYKNSKQGESVFFRKFMKKVGKRVAETTKIFSQHIEAENKGYPKGFKNYHTYDPKHRPREKRGN